MMAESISLKMELWRDSFLIISSFILAFSSVIKNESDNHVKVRLGFFLMFMGFLFFVSFTKLLNRILLSTKFGLNLICNLRLSISECLDITNKLISALQALLSSLFGIFICHYSCRRNFLTTSHIFSEAYAWFGSAYFLYDIWSMFTVYVAKIYDKHNLFKSSIGEELSEKVPSWRKGQLQIFAKTKVEDVEIPSFIVYLKKTKLMIFHHLLIGFYGLIVISSWRKGLGDCIFSFFFMMEFSTPFVSFRAVLSILKLKKTKLYIINGILMILTFLVFRIVMLPLVMYQYSNIINTSVSQAFIRLPFVCKLSIAALFLPQFYWFYLMLKITLKMFKPSPNEATYQKKET